MLARFPLAGLGRRRLLLTTALFLSLLIFSPFSVRSVNAAEVSETPSATPEKPEEAADSQENLLGPSDAFTEEQQVSLEKNAENFNFEAKVNRVLDILINNVYTDKDIFLRELISNAEDALKKARIQAISDPHYLDTDPRLEIYVAVDPEAKTITIQDTGIGMTKQELIQNLGTIARSGTASFAEALENNANLDLIGQFGVGFYSGFLVADRVTVASKSNADPKQHIWESTVNNTYTIVEDPRGNFLKRGTRITLHLKEDATEFTDVNKIQNIIKRYNEFMSFPIKLRKPKPQSTTTTTAAPKDDKDAETTETTASPEEPAASKVTYEWVVINNQPPIWVRDPSSVNESEYHDFYKSFTREGPPLAYSHFFVEGRSQFKAIIFIPKQAPYDAWSKYFSAKQTSIKLYSRRVLVADAHYELLPKWLSFMKGIVDSDNLPLKVDRERLSQSGDIEGTSKKLVSKFFELVRKLAKEDAQKMKEFKEAQEKKENEEDKEKKEGEEKKDASTPPVTRFKTFYEQFSKNLKIGCVEDDGNKNKIAELLRFSTTKTGASRQISLEEYVNRMVEGQKSIYYIANDNFDAAMASPHMQIFTKKGYEVLTLMDPLDEGCVARLTAYASKPFVSIEKANAKIENTEDEKERHKKIVKYFKPLTKYLTKLLDSKVGSVQVSSTLVDDPVAIVTTAYGTGAFGDRIARAQSFGDASERRMVHWSRNLDINPNHPLIKKLLDMAKTSPDDPQLEQIATTLHDAALLNSGFVLENPAPLSRRYFKLLQREVGLENDVVEEFNPPSEDADAADKDGAADKEDTEGGMDDDTAPPEGMENFEDIIATQKLKGVPISGFDAPLTEGDSHEDGTGSNVKIINVDAKAGAKSAEEKSSVPESEAAVKAHDEL